MEQNLPNREIIDATQDAVLNAAGSVANVLENTAHGIGGHGEIVLFESGILGRRFFCGCRRRVGETGRQSFVQDVEKTRGKYCRTDVKMLQP